MRDVMEIENLLLDFSVTPALVTQWLAADPEQLLHTFRPARVRKRLPSAGVSRYRNTVESADYQAHSAALHVTLLALDRVKERFAALPALVLAGELPAVQDAWRRTQEMQDALSHAPEPATRAEDRPFPSRISTWTGAITGAMIAQTMAAKRAAAAKETVMSDWDNARGQAMKALHAEVEANEGILKVNMARLRDDSQWGKLGTRVVVDIAKLLRAYGMGSLPPELPLNQWDEVRVYIRNSRVGQLVRAVEEPSDRGDTALREAATSEASAVLERVRALVCD